MTKIGSINLEVMELTPTEKKEIIQFYQTEINGLAMIEIHHLIQYVVSNYTLKFIGSPKHLLEMDEMRFHYASIIHFSGINYEYKKFLFKRMSVHPDLMKKNRVGSKGKKK
jgi:dTDP-4-amino-4,6-dideoxygalactose transaminase